jgi:hypothetical protein
MFSALKNLKIAKKFQVNLVISKTNTFLLKNELPITLRRHRGNGKEKRTIYFLPTFGLTSSGAFFYTEQFRRENRPDGALLGDIVQCCVVSARKV